MLPIRESVQENEEQPGNLPATATSVALPERTPNRGMNFLNLLMQGGWFMIPLLILSVGAVALTIERAIALRRGRMLPDRLIRRLGQLSDLPGGLDPREAYRICQASPSCAAEVLRSVLLKVGRPQLELEQSLHETSQRKAIEMQQLVSWLTLVAAVAPLIGLLGTVWGITQAFYDTTQMEVGQNRAEALSQGIYTALVTTISGLMIAIPATVAAHFFENRIVTLMNQIEAMILSLLPQLERYEGRVRFVPEDTDSASSPGRSVFSGEPLQGTLVADDDGLPAPLPRHGNAPAPGRSR